MRKRILVLSFLVFCLIFITGFNQIAFAQTQTAPTKLPLISPTSSSKQTSPISSFDGLKDQLMQKLFTRLEAALTRLNKIEDKIITRENIINSQKKITAPAFKNLDKLKNDLETKMVLANKQVSNSAKLAFALEASPSSKENYILFRNQISSLRQLFQDMLTLENQQLQSLTKLSGTASISAAPKFFPD